MGNRAAIALTLCAAQACGGPRAPVGPPPLTARTQRYAPLAARLDAKRAGQAVILGTSERDDATVLPLPGAATTAAIDAMFVAAAARPVTGGAIAVALTTAPNPGGAPQLTGGELSGGAGETRWTAGLWSAAQVAASALGKDLTDVAFSAVPAGPVDDLAGSALIAAGFAAALTGAPIAPDAALAGAVEPDGTIGPVAGIPEQLVDAIHRGKTVLGYPSGMRFAKSLATGKDVDLVQLAHDHRATAVEVASLADAYALVTHKRLPAPVPVSEAEMVLDPQTLHRLDATYLAAQQRLAREWASLLQLEQAGRLPVTIQLLVRLAHDRNAQAEALHRAGKLAAAYNRMLIAWVYAVSANQMFAVLARLAAGDVDAAVGVLAALEPAAPRIAAVLAKLAAQRPTTLGGQLAALATLQAALRSWAYCVAATDAVAATTRFLVGLKDRPQLELSSPAATELVSNALVPAVLAAFRSLAETAIAEQEQDLELDRDPGIGYACAPESLHRLAAGFQATSAAGLRYLDALLVQPIARKAQLTDDEARAQVAAGEPDYLIARVLSRLPATGVPPELAVLAAPAVPAEPAGCNLLPLAVHELTWRNTALLVARYDSLAVHTDDAGKIDGVAHPAALRSLLANAKRTARANARAARIATGAIPVQAKLAYQLATVDESGSLDDQINALAQLWAASAFSQAAAMLARNGQ
jgi:hypothetical protein